MKASEYFRTKRQLVPDILKAYDSLAEEADVIVIEGAGSPAEINLKSEDIVNMGLAEMVDAPVLLVGDIDRGGVFAQLYGTVELLEEKERRRIKGLVINKFRGDVEILRPGLSMLEEKTHLPVVGVVPYLKVDIEDEDSLSQRLEMRDGKKPLDAAIIRLPHLSNFTDFMPLEQHPLLGVRYVSNAHELGAPDLILLPGTKNTVDDLLWLRQCGLETALLKLAAKGTPVLGVCGGYQMLGQTLDDPTGSESGRQQTLRGLGLLPTRTVFSEQKRRVQVKATVAAAPFAGAELEGYEIHTGVTEAEGEPFAHYPDGGRRAVCRAMCLAPTSTVCSTPVRSPRRWRAGSAAGRASTPPTQPSSRWKSTAASSSTSWPTACAGRWIWTRCMPRWEWRSAEWNRDFCICTGATERERPPPLWVLRSVRWGPGSGWSSSSF